MLYLKKKDLKKAFEEFRNVLSTNNYKFITKYIEKDRKHAGAFLEIATIMSLQNEY